MYGIVELYNLLVFVLVTWYFSLCLIFILCSFSFKGKRYLVWSKFKHFFPNVKINFSLLANRVSMFKSIRAFSCVSYLS